MTAPSLDGVTTAGPRPAFFVTPWPWLKHAAGWAVAIPVANTIAPLLNLDGPLSALAVVAAAVTARRLKPEQLDVELADAVRFALVDSVFLGFAGAVLYPVAMLPLRNVALSSGFSLQSVPLAVMIGLFVVQFYGLLWAAGRLRRRRDSWRNAVWVAGCAAGVGLAWSVANRSAERLKRRSEVARAAAQYERETGKPGAAVEAEISLSLHGFNDRPETFVLDSAGRLVVVGEFSLYAAHEARGFARIDHDGGLDRTAPGAALEAQPADVRALADGALLVAVALTPSELSSPLVLRTLQPNGTLEERPNVPVGSWSGTVYERQAAPFDRQADGSIVVGRNGALEPDTEPACVRRFGPDGTEDREFAANVGAARDVILMPGAERCTVTDVRALPDGGILVVFSGPDARGAWRDGVLRRLDSSGRFDSTFQPEPNVYRLAVGERGELFVATVSTSATPPVYALVKLENDGTTDDTFAPPRDFFASIDALEAQRDGRLLVAGRRPGSYEEGVFRLSASGLVEPGFGARGSVAATGSVRRMLTSPDGDIYLLGDFYDVGPGAAALPRYQIARLGADGAPDPTFDPH
jgi:uncharacterized delta-60 repeat protein